MKPLTCTLIFVAALAIGAAPLAAQQQQQPSTHEQHGHPDAANSGKELTAGKLSVKPNTAAQAFVTEATGGNLAEVELGRLADDKASNPEVEKFAQRMVADHGRATEQLIRIAQQKGMTTANELDKKHAAEKDRLSKLSGAEFDRAYMQMMVQAHTETVAKFEAESKKGPDAEVKAWVVKTLPVVQEHLKMAKEVAAKVGASAGTK